MVGVVRGRKKGLRRMAEFYEKGHNDDMYSAVAAVGAADATRRRPPVRAHRQEHAHVALPAHACRPDHRLPCGPGHDQPFLLGRGPAPADLDLRPHRRQGPRQVGISLEPLRAAAGACRGSRGFGALRSPRVASLGSEPSALSERAARRPRCSGGDGRLASRRAAARPAHARCAGRGRSYSERTLSRSMNMVERWVTLV